jgi:hypothetical protein
MVISGGFLVEEGRGACKIFSCNPRECLKNLGKMGIFVWGGAKEVVDGRAGHDVRVGPGYGPCVCVNARHNPRNPLER